MHTCDVCHDPKVLYMISPTYDHKELISSKTMNLIALTVEGNILSVVTYIIERCNRYSLLSQVWFPIVEISPIVHNLDGRGNLPSHTTINV